MVINVSGEWQVKCSKHGYRRGQFPETCSTKLRSSISFGDTVWEIIPPSLFIFPILKSHKLLRPSFDNKPRITQVPTFVVLERHREGNHNHSSSLRPVMAQFPIDFSFIHDYFIQLGWEKLPL